MPRPSIDDIARRILDALPQSAGNIDADLRRNLRAGITGVLARMDFLTRDEFDAQRRVLLRTREKIEALEQRVKELEQRVEHGAPPRAPSHHGS